MSIPQHISVPVFLIAGLTGSGKTALLQWLQQHQQQVIDIETLCRHDGSVFAPLQYTAQPSAYQFHKQLLAEWSAFDPSRPVFIESRIEKNWERLNCPIGCTVKCRPRPLSGWTATGR